MRSSILRHLFEGGGRIWRWAKGGRMLMSTMVGGSSSPWLMLPPGRGSSGDIIYNFYSLAEDRKVSLGGGLELEEGTRFVGSSHGWLALFNDRNKHLFITNPISGRRIDLPPIDTLPNPEINLRKGVSKVVLSCSPDDDDEWRALMTFGPGNSLAFCSGGAAWTPIGRLFQNYEHPHKRFARVYEDMVYWRAGRSFICTPEYEYHSYEYARHCIEYWCFDEDEHPKVTSIYRAYWDKEVEEELITEIGRLGSSVNVSYLVYAEQLNQLFCVVRFVDQVGDDGEQVSQDIYPYKTFLFLVFKVDDGHGRLRWVHSLDGLAMFLGINHSFAVSAADFPRIKPNSIYFTDADTNKQLHSIYRGHDIGVFDLQNRTVSPCYYPPHVQEIDPPPLWFTPAPH